MQTVPEVIDDDLDALLGALDTPMSVVDQRLRTRFGQHTIVWEGDASTFQYTFVGDAALEVLGYPLERWVGEPTFWVDVVIHESDRSDAVSYCALATGLKRHHVFDYRGRAADGRVIWFRDFVKVVLSPKGIPLRLRGFMLDVSTRYMEMSNYKKHESPSRDELDAMSA
ncbi:MAG: PAS domain-containing protein [Deltaproteobacteria bacterium]|nr:PAS domain-containing protein [Deltaproteobacteria bacterium]